jgi:hypothetical protein
LSDIGCSRLVSNEPVPEISWNDDLADKGGTGRGGGVNIICLASDSYVSDIMGEDTVFRRDGGGGRARDDEDCRGGLGLGRSVWEREYNGLTRYFRGGGVKGVNGPIGVSARSGR